MPNWSNVETIKYNTINDVNIMQLNGIDLWRKNCVVTITKDSSIASVSYSYTINDHTTPCYCNNYMLSDKDDCGFDNNSYSMLIPYGATLKLYITPVYEEPYKTVSDSYTYTINGNPKTVTTNATSEYTYGVITEDITITIKEAKANDINKASSNLSIKYYYQRQENNKLYGYIIINERKI